MLSPYLQPPKLLQSPSLGNLFLCNTVSNEYRNKFQRRRHVSVPAATLSPTNCTQTLKSQQNHTVLTRCRQESPRRNDDLLCTEEKLESLDFEKKASTLQVQNFVDAIRALRNEDKADLLNILQKHSGVWDISNINNLLMALLMDNEPDIALKVYSYLPICRLVPDSWTYSITVRCHCKKNNPDEAKLVLNHMVETGFSPNVAIFTTLVHSFCKRGQLQKAFEVMGIMNKIGCRPNVQTYNCLLKGLCYVGRVEEAYELLGVIKESPIKPDIYTYTAVMDGFCKVGRSDEAMELLNEAVERGLTPTAVTFNTLFSGYTKEGKPLKGIRFLDQMKLRNCRPDYVSYSTLLHGLLLWGRVEAALMVYKEMVGVGYKAGERLMNGLLRGLCKESFKEDDHIQKAYEVFEEMKTEGYAMDQSTYGLLIQLFCKGKRVDEALGQLHQLIRLGYIPRVITINRLIGALCVEGEVEKAFSVFVLMHESRKMLTRVSYDLLIREFNRQGRFSVARHIYGAALVRGVAPHRKPRR